MIFTGALYQFSTVRKQTEGTAGLKTTSLIGPREQNSNFLAALLVSCPVTSLRS